MSDFSTTTQLDDVLDLITGTLGPAVVVGAYGHGSAVLAHLRPRSDLDILVVTSRPTTLEERGAITEGLLAISGRDRRRAGDRPVELTIVVRSEVQPWRYPPRSEYLYGEWLRAELEGGAIPEPEVSPDLAPLITMARQGDLAYLGPSPREVLDPVPAGDLRKAVMAGIPGLLRDLEGDEANVLLTFARIWVTLATGEIRAKDVAADWAIERLAPGQATPLARARDVYLGTAADDWVDSSDEVLATVAAIQAAIEALTR